MRIALSLALLFALSAPIAVAQDKDRTENKAKKVSTKDLIKQLADPQQAGAAEKELLALGKKAVPSLAKALNSKAEGVRARAAGVLGRIGKDALPAASSLMAWAMKGDAACLDAMAKLGPKALPQLSRGLTAKDEGLRAKTCSLIAPHGDEAKPAVGALIKALRDKQPKVRVAAADALGKIGKVALPSISALIKMLSDKEAGPAKAAADALKALSKVAKPSDAKKIDKALEAAAAAAKRAAKKAEKK